MDIRVVMVNAYEYLSRYYLPETSFQVLYLVAPDKDGGACVKDTNATVYYSKDNKVVNIKNYEKLHLNELLYTIQHLGFAFEKVDMLPIEKLKRLNGNVIIYIENDGEHQYFKFQEE